MPIGLRVIFSRILRRRKFAEFVTWTLSSEIVSALCNILGDAWYSALISISQSGLKTSNFDKKFM